MDAFGAYIARLHSLLGHDKAAAVIGQDPGDKSECLLCAYEQDPTPERKAAVEQALSHRSGKKETQMSDMTPLEAAEAFLEQTSSQPPAAWIGKAWGADGDPRYLTYETVRALVAQIHYDADRIDAAYAEIVRLRTA